MQAFTLICRRSGERIASSLFVATNLFDRAVGLLKYRTLPDGEALFFPKCNSVHTVGMRFAIDLVFIDAAGLIVHLEPSVVPGRLIFPIARAWGVIELASGAIKQSQLSVGDQLGLLSSNGLEPLDKPF